jgi:hypothetical protein
MAGHGGSQDTLHPLESLRIRVIVGQDGSA